MHKLKIQMIVAMASQVFMLLQQAKSNVLLLKMAKVMSQGLSTATKKNLFLATKSWKPFGQKIDLIVLIDKVT